MYKDSMIEYNVKNEIINRLKKVEETEDVKILFACESGSRAWGFESEDSDYDVRFIYIKRENFYLAIDEGRDVIEQPIVDEIDLSGWDLKKALKLLRKSNPPLLEWLQSPIIYLEIQWAKEILLSLIEEFYSPISCKHHYLHMAKGNFRDYLKKDKVWLKKYFYVLRPILACQWIENDLGPVPMEFDVLVDKLVKDENLKSAIDNLLLIKKNGGELSYGERIPEISNFIEFQLDHQNKKDFGQRNKIPNTAKLNNVFQTILKSIW